MALIAVVEDDPGTLKLLNVVLRNQGHEVLAAAHGALAWEVIRQTPPDVIVSDVNMPGMSGFELLALVREDTRLALTPFILLTSLQERKDMRQGMRLGADDYITKPFQSRELIEAVDAQLNKQHMRAEAQSAQLQSMLSDALAQQARTLGDDYEDRLALALSEQWPSNDHAPHDGSLANATVLCAGILRHADWVHALTADELSRLLKRFHESCGDTTYLFGASHMQFVGDGVVAVFSDGRTVRSAPHGLRAVKAAMGLTKAAVGLRAFINRQFTGSPLPRFDISVALHCGPVGLMRLEGLLGGAAQTVPVGETVIDAVAIQRHAEPPETAITVSVPLLRSVTGSVRAAHRYLLNLPHRNSAFDVCQIEPGS